MNYKPTSKEMHKAALRYWHEERAMTDEELKFAYLRFEQTIIWIAPDARDLPWLREELRECRRRTARVAVHSRSTEARVVAYVELRLDSPRQDDHYFHRRIWYLMPHDHANPGDIPTEARTVESIKVRQKSRHPDEKPP